MSTIFTAPAILTRRTFGRLTAMQFLGRRGHSAYWLCRCSCGNYKEVSSYNLRSGNTKSCGCYRVEWSSRKFTTHGKTDTKIYRVWSAMIRRCYNKRCKDYVNYGGRGIAVCERWRSFEQFYADMGDPPESAMQIDRKNNDGNYEVDNCRWVNLIVQANNKRNIPKISWNGASRSIAEWSHITGIANGTLRSRIYDYGWPLERVFTEAVRVR